MTIPIVDGELGLGALQAIFLCEFDGPRTREIHVVVHRPVSGTCQTLLRSSD